MRIQGAEAVEKVFGRWPSFHDAEVVRFSLARSRPYEAGPSIAAAVHAFEMTNQVGDDGAYVLRKYTLIHFRFAGVDDVHVEGFNNQNALWDLVISDISDRQMEDIKYEVSFASSFGMGARFLCREVLIESVEPWTGHHETAG